METLADIFYYGPAVLIVAGLALLIGGTLLLRKK